ncbi:MAG: hypothetical protein K2O03_08695 [Lachnospiraceae bacterium]|nr:hypothetical protein [Lachnospiraceae bacterium]
MKEKEPFVVDGYSFETKAEWEETKKEEESIRYIRAKTNLSDTETAYKMYCGLVQKKTFITPVGISFLMQLRAGLLRAGKTEEEIPGVPVILPRKKGKRAESFSQEVESKNRMMADYYRDKLRNSRIVVAFLAVVIGVMFLITMFGPNSPFVDAEIKLQDKYAAWEQDIREREDAVRARERELGITGNAAGTLQETEE